MDPSVSVNVAGRVMVLLHKLGIHDARCLRIYRRAVSDTLVAGVSGQGGVDWKALEPVVEQQLVLLEKALLMRVPPCPVVDFGSPGAETAVAYTPPEPGGDSVDGADPGGRPTKRPTGYVPDAKSMEEKLRESRKPVQKLLREDCVQACLVDQATAEDLILGMTGKSSEEAEREIVEHLRESLQMQIRDFIRRTRGEGPWSNPHAQEELRQDVRRMHSVQGVLSMARHVRKEYRSWERAHGWYGILGLFSPRRKQGT